MDFFETAYRGKPPWEIGRPQKEFVALVRQGGIAGSVLDIGCGTGDNALFFAAEGHEVWGIDAVPAAIAKAQAKARAAGREPPGLRFCVLDARELPNLHRKFDTVTDSGFFHTLSDAERPVYAGNLATVLDHGGRYCMLCFSDREQGGYGPRRVTQQEIRECFRDGWIVHEIRPAVFESNTRPDGAKAWLALIRRE